jgi:hypothetical protein
MGRQLLALREKGPSMLRAGKLARLAGILVGLMTAVTLLAAGEASASAAATAATVGTATPKTFTAAYSCDLSGYGTSLAPVSVSATLSFAPAVQAQDELDITLTTTSVALPSSVLSQLTPVTSFGLSAAVTAPAADKPTVTLSGTTPVSSTLSGLPAAKATGSARFTVAGTEAITVPAPHLVFTPHTATGKLAAIRCTTSAATKSVPVTVSPHVIGTEGPLYKCVRTLVGKSSVIFGRFPAAVTSSGGSAVGKTVTVKLASGAGILLKGMPAKSISFTADLPVTGAQQGTIPLSKAISDARETEIQVSGKLRLTKAGTDQILVPGKLKLTFNLVAAKILVPTVIACAIDTSHVPVAMTLKVANAHPQPSPSPSPTGSGGVPEGSGTPTGAPDTGGGTGSGTDITVAAGGLAIVISGGGLVFLGRRRRHGP